MQSKRMSATQEMLKGVYPKFQGIAGRNALILHCTYAAIAGTVPDQLIPASTVQTAIAWTKWELSQTLLQYQLLGLTDDPELSRILKFIDKFTGKGWVSARDVHSWWSTKSDRTANNIRQFMAKVVGLGYAINNDQPAESNKYQIQISGKSAHNAHKKSETYTESESQMRTSEPAKSTVEKPEPNDTNVGDVVGDLTHSSTHKSINYPDLPITQRGSESAGNFAGKVAHKPETTLNGRPIGSSSEIAGNSVRLVHTLPSNSFSDVVGIVGTFPDNKNLKIGERVMLGEEIITIDRIEDDFIGGRSDDGSYLGGYSDSVRSLSVDELPVNLLPTNGKIDRVPLGNGMVQIVRQEQLETIAAGEIEYEC